jgi:glycosyltransferase involved in cell wall biosynthesis
MRLAQEPRVLRIAIDAHSVGTRLAGNETYAVNLIEALAQVDQTNNYILYVTKKEAVDRFQDRWPNFSVVRTLPHSPLIRIPLTLSVELRRHPVDVLHVQFTAPPLAPCPVVVSIHDLSFEHLPETFKRHSRMQMRLTIRRSARNAAHILALSKSVRDDIIQTYGIPGERITTIPLAAAQHFRPVMNAKDLQRVRHTYGITGDYILSVGSLQPRKNLRRLVQAYSRLRDASLRVKLPSLVLVGKKAWLFGDTLRAIEQSGVGDQVLLTDYVSEADLPALYSGALCFVYPSYFEGFGLPPLEAMQCGTPVIVGNRTSLPEVVGEAGLLVNPFDEGEITEAMARLIDNPDLRGELRVKGLERAAKFTWQETARRTLDVYRQVAGSRVGV